MHQEWIQTGFLFAVIIFLIILLSLELFRKKRGDRDFLPLEKELLELKCSINNDFSYLSHQIENLTRCLDDVRSDTRDINVSSSVLADRINQKQEEMISCISATKSVTNTVAKRGRPRKNLEKQMED